MRAWTVTAKSNKGSTHAVYSPNNQPNVLNRAIKNIFGINDRYDTQHTTGLGSTRVI